MTLLAAFTLGLLSTFHCLGMCGGITGALTLSLPSPIRTRAPLLALYVFLYNAARLTSYTLAGMAAGGMGGTALQALTPAYGHLILRLAATLTMAAIGLYVAGWFPPFARLEHLGLPLWRHLEPLARRFLPIRTPWQALAFGALWGWLPCGLVYALLILAATSGSALRGGLLMLAFGLGTLPGLLGMGILTPWMMRLMAVPHMRKAVGLAIVALAAISLSYEPLR